MGRGDTGVRIFAAFRHFNWEEHNLTPALQTFGDVVRYDWHPPYNQYDPGWHYGLKSAMNREMLQRVDAAHKEQPLDVFYGYLCGRLVHRGYIEALRLMDIPTLNMTLDDKTHRYSSLEPTSDPTAVDWYEEHDARAIYLPAGANPDLFKPVECERDIDVLFVGKKYGRRESLVWHLEQAGIDVQTYGQGWERGPVSIVKMVELMNRAKITLGMGEAADGTISLKGRDFEAPMAGAFYLTQYNPELLKHDRIGCKGFTPGHIDTWENTTDLIDKCKYYLAHQQETEYMRHAAAKHAREHHTWRARFETAFEAMGLL